MTDWKRAIGVGLAAPIAVALVILAFLWPMATMEAKGIDIAVTGTEQQVQAVTGMLEQAKPGLFEVTAVDSRDDAVAMIERREVYGGIVVGQEPEVLTASAAGAQQTAVIKNLAAPLQKSATAQAQAAAKAKGVPAESVPEVAVATTDVVPLSGDDPQGLGLNMTVLPIAFGGMIGGALLSFGLKRARDRILGLVIFAPLAGMAIAWVMGSVFGLLPAGFWSTMGVFTLGIGATAAFIVGLRSVFGTPGFAIGALSVMLLGNPLAGTMAPKEFIAGGWGTFGQYLPNGATATLLRIVEYFPQAGIAQQVWTLLAWLAVGLVLLGVGVLREVRGDKREPRVVESRELASAA